MAPNDPLDDLVNALADNPEAGEEEQAPRGEEPRRRRQDNSEADPADELEEDPEQPEEDDPEDPDAPEEEPEEARQGLKFKVPVKGEDGADTTIEVDEKELIAGYQRHSDYTRKTMELANRQREAYEAVSQKLDEGRNYFIQQAQLAHVAIRQLAGLKTDQEMAQLAATDQAAWVQEKARNEAVMGVLSHLQQAIQNEQQQADFEQKQQAQQEFHKAWGVLGQAGIDKPKLAGIFEGIAKTYGVAPERFKKVSDPALVLIMRDAMAYQELKGKVPSVKQKVQNAPRLPSPRQTVPKSERVMKQLDAKFKSGRAKDKDLAAFIDAINF